MKLKISLMVILAILVVQLSACSPARVSNSHMKILDAKKEYHPSEGKALLIVERSDEVNLSYYAMVIWDVTTRSKPVLVGYLDATMKSAYELEPGKHTLLLQLAATNNMMELEVEANKTYFTTVETNGFYTAIFTPVKAGMKNPITRSNISVATPKLMNWSRNKKRLEGSVQTRYGKGKSKWLSMSDSERDLRSFVPEDGR